MLAEEPRRVLVAVRPTEEPALRSLFAREALAARETARSASFEKAHFLLQHRPCDVLLLDESLLAVQGEAGLGWLARQREVPAVLLAGPAPELWARAYGHGVCACVPRPL